MSGSDGWTCSGCNMTYVRRAGLMQHRRYCVKIPHQANSPDKPRLCPVCGEYPRLCVDGSYWVVGCCARSGRSTSIRMAVLRWNLSAEDQEYRRRRATAADAT